jgi:hypothetical protein
LNINLLNRLPFTSSRVLDIDCGDGANAFAYRRRNPGAFYAGLETNVMLANQARKFCSVVYEVDPEHPSIAQVLEQNSPFDLVIIRLSSAGLEGVFVRLAKLRPFLSTSALAVLEASNLARYTPEIDGLNDALAALPSTVQWLNARLNQIGWRVIDAKASRKSEDASQARNNRSDNSFANDWVFRLQRLTEPVREILNVAAIGLKRTAGVTEARVDYPLSALRAEPYTRVIWEAGQLAIPNDMKPGILMLHRYQLSRDDALSKKVEGYIEKGWVVVLDFDDDPRFWPDNVKNEFFGFRQVHAVSVSTPKLEQLISKWNPNVRLLPNAVFEAPWLADKPTRASNDRPIRIFYGALNREEDIRQISSSLLTTLKRYGERIEIEVVHDKSFFDSLPDGLAAKFHSLLPVNDYHQLLMSCDIALLPLRDTEFNRCKSDLKFIESCAYGVVPVCSDIVYGDRDTHRPIGIFPNAAENWGPAVEILLNDHDDLNLRRNAGRAYVLRERMHAHLVREREAWYRELLDHRTTIESQRRDRLLSADR